MNKRIIAHVIFKKDIPLLNKTFQQVRIPVKINRPGLLLMNIKAEGQFKNIVIDIDRNNGNNKPYQTLTIPGFTIKLLDPNGIEFSGNSITDNILNKYRDLRGLLDKKWTLVIDSNFKGGPTFKRGTFSPLLKITETIPSVSAKPLVDQTLVINNKKDFFVDLYRLGKLKVSVLKKTSLLFYMPDNSAKVSLTNPEGNLITANADGSFTINMKHLRLSRKQGKVQKWKLTIEGITGERKILAQVYDMIKIPKDILLGRLKYIFGDNGENVELGANWIGGELLNIFTLKPKSQVFAENIEYYNLVEMINPKLEQGDIILNKSYTLYERRIFYKKLIFSSDTKFKNLQIAGIKFSMGQSTERKYVASTFHTPEFSLNSDFPFLHFDTGVESEIAIKPANLPQLSIEITTSGTIDMINNNLPNIPGIEVPKITFEVAFDKKDGRVICKCWIKITTNKGAEVDNLCNTMARGYILQRANKFLSGLMEEIFDNLLGDVLDITTTRWNKASDAMEIEYIADVLSERKPNSKYQHVIGRATQSIIQNRNSWVSEELTKDPNKIKHIVVLMMENRSFDHVLGYLSLPNANTSCAEDENDNTFSSPAINPEVNGLTPNIIEEFSDNENRIRHLKCAKFKESTTTDTGKIRTKIPIGVGHNYTDALEQINKGSMKGFVKNFKKFQSKELQKDRQGNTRTGTEPQDVLGYYTDEDLKMYKYLVDNFAICDDYYSSHPGPTLPNRMFSLTGDLQMDRNGEPKLENSVDTSFFLSREISLFDILDQESVSWKVYESFPSVTMLRMFTRYAGDNTRIVNINQLKADIVNARPGTKKAFPSVVFIDPAMHDAPMNDDHPPADMLHGQHLIKEVYDALRSNDEVWNHTLFVINYDEHGGLFDHVPPKVAEIFTQGLPDTISEGGRATSNSKDPVPVEYGVRVPCFIVSPYVEKGSVIHTTLDHSSILKTILVRFCNVTRPFLSDRVFAANHLGQSLQSKGREKIPDSPDDIPSPDNDKKKTSAQVAKAVMKDFTPISKKQLSSENADFHEFLAFLARTVKPEKPKAKSIINGAGTLKKSVPIAR